MTTFNPIGAGPSSWETALASLLVLVLATAGPLAGLVVFGLRGELVEALPLILIATALSIAPFVASRSARDVPRRVWLMAAAAVWLASGWYFIIGVWI